MYETYEVTEAEARRALETVRNRLRSGEITDEQFEMEVVVNGCGTAGCIGGHAARVLVPDCWLPSRVRKSGTPDVGEVMLGIETVVPSADRLFYSWGEDPSREKAVEAIDRCLAGLSDPWRVYE